MTASASTIPKRPVAEAQTPEQQRLEVELLLKEAVLSSADLRAAGGERWSWHPQLSQANCQTLGCLPVQLNPNHLVVAVPTHWSAEQRENLCQAAAEGPALELRLALQGDLHSGAGAEPERGSSPNTSQ